jgi:type I restriction enzyme S subunit
MRTLSDICEVYSGYALKEFNDLNDGLPVIKIGNIMIDGTLQLEECQYTSEVVNEKYYSKKGDIYIALSGATTGKIGILESDVRHIINQRVGVVRKKDDEVPQQFVKYFLMRQTDRILQEASGCAQPNISPKQIAQYEVPELSKTEMYEISNILDKLSAVITQRKDEIQKLEKLIKARFVELFGDAVANPMKWPMKKLKDLSVQINSGNTPKGGSENYVEKGITFFRSQNVWKDQLEMDDIAYIDAETHASMKRSSLKHGDILMTKTGRINTENSSLGRAALYDGEDDMANVNGHVYFIRLKKGVNNKFVLRILVSPEYRDLIRSVCVGGIDKRQLNKEHIEDFPIICPPSDMIDDYIVFVEQVDKSKFAIQKSLEKTQLLFDSLMQKYFG